MNPRLYLLALLVTVGLALTPFYTLSFILVIAFVSRWNPWRSSIFASYLTRFILQFLLLDAVIMLVGMYCWYAGIAVQPLIVIAVYLSLYRIARRLIPAQNKGVGISYHDKLALTLAAVGPVILLICFYAPSPSLADSIRLITNGYDNTAHLSLIETVYRTNGYVYGHYQQIKEQVAWSTLTAYPQGWHLANAIWWKGTGAHLFSGSDASLRINYYIMTMLMWQLIGSFLFTRISLYIADTLGLAKRLREPGIIVGFGAVNLLFEMLLFWGTAFYGFTPFLCAVTYLLLVVAAISVIYFDKRENKYLAYTIALVAAGALTMAWLLPAPLVLLMIALAFAGLTDVHTVLKFVAKRRQQVVIMLLASMLILIPILAMVGINHLYSTEGSNQINDNGGIFAISSGLVLLVLALTTYIVATSRYRAILRLHLITAAPIMLGVILIYAYQMATLGHTVYFFVKMTAILLVVVGPFCCAAVVKIISKLDFDKWPQTFVAATTVLAVSATVVFSGQPIFNFTSLLNRSVIANTTARPLAELAHNGELVDNHVLVFTGHPSPDLQGSVFATSAPLHFDQCIANVEWAVVNAPVAVPDKTRACTASGDQIIFVTSAQTNSIITSMHDPLATTVLAH